MPETVPVTKLVDFSNHPPFHLLPQVALDQLARTLVIEYFPKGEVILTPEGPPRISLHHPVRGREDPPSRRRRREGLRLPEDGEFFGLISLLSDNPHRSKWWPRKTPSATSSKRMFLIGSSTTIRIYRSIFTVGPSKGYKQFGSEVTSFPTQEKESWISDRFSSRAGSGR